MPLLILLILNFFIAMIVLAIEGLWFILIGYSLTVWILFETGSQKEK